MGCGGSGETRNPLIGAPSGYACPGCADCTDHLTWHAIRPRRGGRYRRARNRWEMQRGRRLRKRGVCPCSDLQIANPGPHLGSCLWSDPDYEGGF